MENTLLDRNKVPLNVVFFLEEFFLCLGWYRSIPS